jgi:APA family basic amino acid/polyamine antiporter
VWTTILIIWGTFNKLLFFTGVVVWLFFSLAVAGLFVLRYKFPQIERPFKVWGYPVIPAIFILICVALFINTIVFYPVESFIGLCLMMSGIPIFIFSQRRKEKSL